MSPFGRSKKNSTEGTESRRKHISSLYTHHLAIRELQTESLYEITITTSPSTNLILTLILSLPPTFPDAPPTIQVKPAVSHPWVNHQGFVVGHEKLALWDGGVMVGKVVKDVVQEFQSRPPQRVVAGPPATTYATGVGSAGGGAYGGAAGPQGTGAQGMNPGQYPGQNPSRSQSTPHSHSEGPPPPPSRPQGPQQQNPPDYPELERLKLEDLQKLLSDEQLFTAYFENLDSVKNMRQVHAELMQENEALAHKTLSKEQALADALQSITEQQTLLRSQIQLLEETAQQRDAEAMRFAPEYLTRSLRTSVHLSEEASDSLAASFISSTSTSPASSGPSSAEEFIKQLREIRKLYHLRAAVLERVVREPRLLVPRGQGVGPVMSSAS
ncbi:uncharacterized protein EV422DRAFT_572109 [Fimicolochytrium jonesii]|uniref:uncharacterized protein n=1 Tax=Fimicolochytrium jonesii TaxID=1396493 RepID=UPI0022FE5EE2|nr:uncharacterized protein EV422DRAFT_572109 [Fimicolochytrium jonesii]KAI8816048.1 hypothetical protein EV422DRAFT_572109 [Fimicolochytrium jonesii]